MLSHVTTVVSFADRKEMFGKHACVVS